MKPNVVSEKPVTAVEVRQELARIKEKMAGLSTRATRTEDYLNQTAQLEPKKAKELFDKIMKLSIPRLKEQHICKIIDIMPANESELKAVLQGYVVTVSAESIKKIAAVVAEYNASLSPS
jgi:DNA-directed RNA polymerase subunit F